LGQRKHEEIGRRRNKRKSYDSYDKTEIEEFYLLGYNAL
jgi:hypothetical protein